MKQIYLSAALLICAAASACAPAPSNLANANANANAANSNAANANAASSASWTNDELIADERAVWDAIKRKDSAALSAMLAPELVHVNAAGAVLDKAGTIEYAKGVDLTEVALSDFRVHKIDADAAIVIYKDSSKGTAGGRPIPAGSAYHSTVKALRGGKWVALYHQASPEMAAPPPTPAPTAAASSPSPAATAATPAPTTADVEANERLVWAALQRKDWDAFAGYLADEQIEVWGTGISDKAGTLKGIRNVDFSSFQMSDLKTVPVDEDAKIVTYTVKGVGPDRKPFTERGATVWAVRGGRWLAIFHQGTFAAQ